MSREPLLVAAKTEPKQSYVYSAPDAVVLVVTRKNYYDV
jgi:hypothetical protein